MHGHLKLGRKPPTKEQKAKAPRLMAYMRALPPAPPEVDNTADAVYRMYENDRFGDCTIAGAANYFSTVAAREGECLAFDDKEVVDYYLHLSGGKDEGLVEIDVLERLTSHGFPLDPCRKLAAWVRLDTRDLESMKSAVSVFWCLYLGVSLPIAAQSQPIWDVGSNLSGDYEPGSWGGHAIVWPKYTVDGPEFVTWGELKKATWPWLRTYCEEAYCLLDEARARMWGVDWDKLVRDLHAMRND